MPISPRIYECKELEEPVCQENANVEKFDPRSYCHNILAKTKKVCKKSVCRKFLKTNELRTHGEIVCIPRPSCKIRRNFGPGTDSEADDDDEKFFRMFGSQLGLVLDEGTVSETDILKGRFEGKERITRDGRPADLEEYDEEIDENGNVIRKRRGVKGGKPGTGGQRTQFGIVQNQQTAELLEELSKCLDAEGMAAIAALGGAEICPCCQCSICKCRLRGITSETLLAQRKKALLESKLKSWGKQGYVWSFDYYYKPDFEFFEREREERQHREDQEMHREEALHSSEEELEGHSGEGVIIEDIERKHFAEVQATPSIKEEEVQIRSEMLVDESQKMKEASAGERLPSELEWLPAKDDEVPDFGQQLIGISVPLGDIGTVADSSILSKNLDDIAIGQYVRSTQRSSIESWVETREPMTEGRRPTTVTGASIEPIDIAFPSAVIQGPVRLLSKEIIKPVVAPTKKRKYEKKPQPKAKPRKIDIDLHTPVLKRLPSESYESYLAELTGQLEVERSTVTTKTEMVPLEKIPLPPIKSDETSIPTIDLEELPRPEDAKIDVLTFDEAAKARALSRKRSLTPSAKYGDICDCLPGFCVCSSKHFVFKKADESIQSKPSTEDRPVQTESKDDKMMDIKDMTEEGEEDTSAKSSCICFHPWEEIDQIARVTPAQSICIDNIQAVRKPKIEFICTQPTYQKTVIIVKPEAMNFKDVILRAIKHEGLDKIDERLVQLTPEQVAEVYCENYGSAYFPMFVQKMSSTPILVLLVAGNYAVDRWKYIIGQGEVIPSSWFYPESMKRRFGIHCDIYGAMRTSAGFSCAKNEIRYFFPLDILEPIIIDSVEVQDYCDKYIHPVLVKALYKIVDEKPEDPLLFLAEWILRNNPFQPHYIDSLVAMAHT